MNKPIASPDDAGAERRAHPRLQKSFELSGDASGGEPVARMVASDLSLGGLYCVSNRDYAEMTQLSVRLDLSPQPDSEENGMLEVDAVVVRRNPLRSPTTGESRYELALFFTGLTDDQRERIAGFLALP